VFKARTEIATVCQQMADERDEPPLDDDALTRWTGCRSMCNLAN